jgi:rRNA-processing protein FCF1
LEPPIVVVLEGQARRGAEESAADGVRVVHARGEGDDTIASIAGDHRGDAVVVTADRGLAERVRAVDGNVRGPRWLLDVLD